MRLFIAIELSDEMRAEVAQAEAHLRYAGADVKWVAPKNIHLTLKFLGEVPEKTVPVIAAALDAIGRETAAFAITLGETGAFPQADHAKVVWVGLAKGANETTTLADKIETALMHCGFPRERRPFAPHLTVGRVRSGKNRSALQEKLATCHVSPKTSQTIHAITLVKSTLTPQGPIYTALHTSPFTA